MGGGEKKKLPGHVLAGYLIMGIASLGMLAAAGYLISKCILSPLRFPIEEGGAQSYFADRMNVAYFSFWVIISVAFLLSAVSGASYILHGRFLVQITGLMAILDLVLFLVMLALCCTYSATGLTFFYDFITTSLPGLIYFVGWFLAKNYFDD